MRLLLDTHIWVWSQLAPHRLTRKVRRALEDSGAELWLSPISVWELLLLIERRRVAVTGDPGLWVQDALRAGPFREAPLTHAVALESRLLARDTPSTVTSTVQISTTHQRAESMRIALPNVRPGFTVLPASTTFPLYPQHTVFTTTAGLAPPP